MRVIIWMLLSLYSLNACSGDCLSCHPKLEATILFDERHKPMLTCKKCHTNETGGISECGKDCFSCHPIERISADVKEHDVIKLCADCHKKIPVINESVPFGNSQTTMKSLLFQ